MKIRSLLPRALTLLALALPVAAITVLAKRYSAEVSALEHARVELLRQDARLEMQRSHVRELSRLLGQVALPGVEVSGDTVGEAQQAFAERMSRRRLVFVLSPYCGACTASLPFLDSLETERPGSVLGVAFSITALEAQRYADDHSIRFPIIVNPRGYLADLFPRHATPIFVIHDEARIMSIDIGLFPLHRAAHAREMLLDAKETPEVSP